MYSAIDQNPDRTADACNPAGGECPRSLTVDILLLCGPLVAVWFGLSGLGGWPSNDDPFYGRPVQFFADEGRWQMVRQYGHLTATSAGHIVTGAGFCGLFGFSYRALFLVCLAQQCLGLLAIRFTARQTGLDRFPSLALAMALATCPLYFGHAFTFMTDGPATAWTAAACACLVTGVVRSCPGWLLAGSLCTGWGFWFRQTNVLVVIAPVAAMLLNRNRRATHWLAVLSFVGVSVALLESGWIVHASEDRLADIRPDASGMQRFKNAAIGGYGFCLLAGWLCLPLLPWLIAGARRIRPALPRWQRLTCRAAYVGALIATIGPFVATNGRACLTSATGTFIANAHFGPVFLSDMDEAGRWGDLGGVEWSWVVWRLITVAAIFTLGFVAWHAAWTVTEAVRSFGESLRTRNNDALDRRLAAATGLVAMMAVSVVLVLLFVQPLMDRYWLFLFPPLLIWLALTGALQEWPCTNRMMVFPAVAFAGLMAMSVIFTHDMLSWNNARWTFVMTELNNGVPPEQIDAGRDVNAWFRMAEDPDTSRRAGDSSSWWSGRATRCLAVGPRPGWEEVGRLPWSSWATGRTHHLLILRKTVAEVR